jgi:hypothetical protein
LGFPVVARADTLHLPAELPPESFLGGLGSPVWTEVAIGPGPLRAAALTSRALVVVTGAGDQLTPVSLAENRAPHPGPHRLEWTGQAARALAEVLPAGSGRFECLASEGDHDVVGLLRLETGPAILRLYAGSPPRMIASDLVRRVRPDLVSADVTACSLYARRLYVATSDGAVVALLEYDSTGRPQLFEGFRFRMPRPPRPVIGLSVTGLGDVFAVTGDEHVYFFTPDGAPDERIDPPTAEDLRPPS